MSLSVYHALPFLVNTLLERFFTMTEHKILIVEDDKKSTELLCDYLVHAGFNISVQTHGDGVIYEISHNQPELMALDIVLPDKDGMTSYHEIRAFFTVPILLMLIAKGEEIDRLLDLELGANDYTCKPVSQRKMIARVKAILRRATFDELIKEKN